MVAKLSEADLASSLTDVLDRVRDGEQFVVERNGEEIAVLVPPAPIKGITGRELAARLGDLRVPEGFADDLEAIQASQSPPRIPEWPD